MYRLLLFGLAVAAIVAAWNKDALLSRWKSEPPSVQNTRAEGMSPQARYELQERCGDRAKRLYETDYEVNIPGKVISGYENHFNAALGKCFLLVWTKAFDKSEAKLVTLQLFDVNERRSYGLWSSSDCEVRYQLCTSETEWWSLTRPYIE